MDPKTINTIIAPQINPIIEQHRQLAREMRLAGMERAAKACDKIADILEGKPVDRR